jgi:hypothetical protein
MPVMLTVFIGDKTYILYVTASLLLNKCVRSGLIHSVSKYHDQWRMQVGNCGSVFSKLKHSLRCSHFFIFHSSETTIIELSSKIQFPKATG